MTITKEQYLNSIRNGSAYPIYRATIGIIAMIGYGIAGLYALGAVFGGLGSMFGHQFGIGFMILVGGALLAALVFFCSKLFKEAALIIVDIGDSTLEANARSLSV
jgi:hypothetical protein